MAEISKQPNKRANLGTQGKTGSLLIAQTGGMEGR
jgi:hypothetical protein